MQKENQNKLILQDSSKANKNMKFRYIIIVFLVVSNLSFGQNKKSKADIYFYEYNFTKAIQEYRKEEIKWPLTQEQRLKLADSYFQTKDFKNAAQLYVNINKENDTILSTHRVNKMLQSLSKNNQKERVDAFLQSKSHLLSEELFQNYQFNKELLAGGITSQDFKIENLSINSSQADFSPSFYKDKILFSSSRIASYKKASKSKEEGYLDIYIAKVNSTGEVLNPNPFTEIPKFSYHEATPYYSETLKKLFYIRSNSNGDNMAFNEEGKNSLAIGVFDETNVFRYLLKDLSTSFYYPFYEVDTNRLYFAANFSDSFGGTDLYYVETNNGQIMSRPINLGAKINTPANEIAPYIHNGSLYYASDIFYGFGGMDIYKTSIQADQSFSIPINLGNGINSKSDDFGLIIKNGDSNNLTGYFSSNRAGGKGKDDIYKFSVSDQIGLKTFSIRGRVVNSRTRRGVEKAFVKLLNNRGSVIREIYTNDDGDYSIELPWQKQITINTSKEGYSSFSVTYNEEGMVEAQKVPLNMGIVALKDLIEEKENKKVIKLNKFYFDKGRSEVTPLIAAELDKVIEAIRKFPQLKLSIETHTSSKGYNSTNKKISQKRSDAIKFYLLKNGASVSNIVGSIGYGEEQIINRCVNGAYCLDFLHKQNERTLIVLVK
ncbi:OmpA family protein [uncultured Maribacter sp.]|uniref:OmpA family protein n=1 Tax=uncultured Maribacter sp. TaxID=431308 RepID=UPI00260214CE|nr:OmpA family protein [uncultured Maribacter sp.]